LPGEFGFHGQAFGNGLGINPFNLAWVASCDPQLSGGLQFFQLNYPEKIKKHTRDNIRAYIESWLRLKAGLV
jgi:hypothetical protein